MNASALLTSCEPGTPEPSTVGLPTMPAGDVVAQPHRSIQCDTLEKLIAGMECAKEAVAFFDASAALAAIVNLVQPGEEIVVGTNLDAATCRVFSRLLWQRGVTVWCVDPAELAEAVTARTRLVYVQTHGGARAVAADVPRIADTCSSNGALLVVDATAASPLGVQPLMAGADLVIHTGSTLVAGTLVDDPPAFISSDSTALLASLKRFRERSGTYPPEANIQLILSGIETLAERLRKQQKCALRLARFLSVDPAIARVEYPGLRSRNNPGAPVQASRPDGIELVFETLNPLATRRVVDALNVFRAGIFDGTRSAVSIPATHGSRGFPEIDREASATPLVIRLTIGLESPDQLLCDLVDALENATGS